MAVETLIILIGWLLQTGKHVFRMYTDLMKGNMAESAEILLLVDAGQLQRNYL